MYKIAGTQELKRLSDYTFAFDKTVVFQCVKELPFEIQTINVKTEFDLAKSWCEFAQSALGDDEYAESEIVCWHGHYELFGRVMLELMRLSRDKDSQRYDPAIYAMTPDLQDFSFISEPTGSEDRMFYRIWFSYIGHPDFQQPRILNAEAENYEYWEYLINYVTMRVENDFRKSLDN